MYVKLSFCDSGTGKSETGAHIAYALAMSNRIKNNNGCVLYSAPTNKAVDVVLSKLIMCSRPLCRFGQFGQNYITKRRQCKHI